jgi:hypothetical protein
MRRAVKYISWLFSFLRDRYGDSNKYSNKKNITQHICNPEFTKWKKHIYIAGFTTLDMVKRYLAIAQTDLDSDYEKASPVKVWKL